MKIEIEIDEKQLQQSINRDINKVFDPNGYGNGHMFREHIRDIVASQAKDMIKDTDLRPYIQEHINRTVAEVVKEVTERQTRRLIRGIVNTEIEKLKASAMVPEKVNPNDLLRGGE